MNLINEWKIIKRFASKQVFFSKIYKRSKVIVLNKKRIILSIIAIIIIAMFIIGAAHVNKESVIYLAL